MPQAFFVIAGSGHAVHFFSLFCQDGDEAEMPVHPVPDDSDGFSGGAGGQDRSLTLTVMNVQSGLNPLILLGLRPLCVSQRCVLFF